MIIFGARGLAKELLEICLEIEPRQNISFYDDISSDPLPRLFNEFHILRTPEEANRIFTHLDARFAIGIGNPKLRLMAFNKFKELGGIPITTVSSKCHVGSFDTQIGEGSNIMIGSVVTNSVKIGKGVLINQLVSIGHDVEIGDFVEVCPGASISGNCKIGNGSFLGTNCIVLPNVTIGRNAVIGAGSVITKDVPENCTVVGVPGRIIKVADNQNIVPKSYSDMIK